ncbi:D-alanyl-D-alanine carboxypeptidase [Streptomyces cocklensis]|jgi:D-alanyl-D-alanine carboxypeptidase (penicillin-binding protein 5/6)|nr:serine hydrolase [Actinacidiphila cocklensis]MDD1059053.1 D-alanyl-D-alanine carboxypeptidase [Actinacidiphila cocklensis]WSX73428.1 D-alanyl-D-alanine carboxypeptidase [Streptomyces sp. NBC_00899]WSX80506.1 D-alanyl-D-alanine carboxypeptidase [Streptomyces sp. NBC_00899]
MSNRRAATRVRRRVAAVFGAGCCLAVLAVPAYAAGDSQVGGALLGEPGVHVDREDGAPRLPSGISALSWTVSDARTGQVLAAKNAHRELPPASTLKTLFAVTVLPRFPADETHTVADGDLEGIGAGSSLVGVQAGQTYTVADLWRGVFLASGNDAVHVLAHMNGSVPLTVSQMQAKAEMLGADDTHVVSPDGYDYPGQVSSAYDLALFARAGLANRDFASYASTVSAQFPGGFDAHGVYVKSFGIQNTNRLLTGASGVTPYPGLIGVKNGYTTNAGNTLVAAATREGRTLIVTVMNPQSGLPQAVYKEAAKLLDWGFDAAGRSASVGTLNAAPTAYHLKGIPAQAPAPAKQEPKQQTRQKKAAPSEQKPAPAPAAHSSNTSARAWYVGGGLAVVAAASVLLLRRRTGGGRNR